MDALILAAGEGTRLRPLTNIRPKPLLPVLNRPLLQWTLDYLNRFSIDRVILNTHHLAGQFETILPSLGRGGIRELVTRFEPLILNTGGGLVNTKDFFRSDPFIVISGDILTDIDLKKAVEFHQSHSGPVTLVLHDYPEFNRTRVDPDGRIRQFRTEDHQGLDFANIHILDRTVFNLLPDSGGFDIIPAYQKIIDRGITIRAYVSHDHYWRNIGRLQSYLQAHEELLSSPVPPLPFLRDRKEEGGKILIHPENRIEGGVEFTGWACIGKGCILKKGCRIQNSVLWENAVVEPGVVVSGSVVGDRARATRDLAGEMII